ncbi:MAG: hypothetical protein ACTHMA_21215 [Thermomicrobiales bacterium]
MNGAGNTSAGTRETTAEEVRTVEVRVPVIRLPRLSTGESIALPRRQRVADLCDYLADHIYEHRAALDAAHFRALLDEYARYRLLAAAGIEEYPIVIAE